MNSIFGLLKASVKQLPSFQHVIWQGESVQYICISEPPLAGYEYFTNWFSTGTVKRVVIYQLIGGFSIA